jgi:hypothetical protein
MAVAAIVAGCAVPAAPGGWPSPPRTSPVSGPLLVSADGRVITGIGSMACGHAPRLVTRSSPRKVALIWVNPDTNCHAEMIGSAVARARLPSPLGHRALVQAASGKPVHYFGERDLVRVGVLPAGFRLSSDLPFGIAELPSVSLPGSAVWAVGDTRTYTGPAGTAAQLSIAQLAAAHGFNPLPPWPWPAHVRVDGRPAALLVDRANGLAYSRSITWVARGYRFVVNIFVHGQIPHPAGLQIVPLSVDTKTQVPLSNAQLVAVADGIRSRLPWPDRPPARERGSPGHRRQEATSASVSGPMPASLAARSAPRWYRAARAAGA